MFSPLDGVGEDAATGSAAGPLACHLGRHGVVPWGEEIEIEQGTEIGRPSTLYARASGSGEDDRVRRGRRLRGHRRPRRVQASVDQATASMSGSSGASERQKRAPSVRGTDGCARRRARGPASAASTATSNPGGRPPPDSCQVAPASHETSERRPAGHERHDSRPSGRGGDEPRQVHVEAGRGRPRSRRSPRTASASTSTSKTPSTVRTQARITRSCSGVSLELDFEHAGGGRRGLASCRERPVPGRSRPGVGREERIAGAGRIVDLDPPGVHVLADASRDHGRARGGLR